MSPTPSCDDPIALVGPGEIEAVRARAFMRSLVAWIAPGLQQPHGVLDDFSGALTIALKINLPQFYVTHAMVAAVYGQRDSAAKALRGLPA